MVTANRKPTNVTISSSLLAEAKDLDVNLSRAAEAGIAKAVAAEKARLWKLENAEALASSNQYVAKNGLPLEKFRQF
ncbi:type II toxin-antitoxin system CcdA family antitoxin [Maritalea sp.]|jgi:antitoxin CcdA|uniref:type II toxin-antitoxin system CcdA family antitoxin n=1 Tax=Maritalea sp. TaxID=2003361 RepID=UPI0039E213E0